MTRPLRIEFPGALYHVTARGDRRAAIYRDDRDRNAWLEVVGMVCERFNVTLYAYCQMTNHFHLLVETVEGNLGQCMRQLNGIYTQKFNRRHSLVGHVLQGRYKAILVQKQSYLLTLARYIVLNPVRAGMVVSAEDWRWSSHRFLLGEAEPPAWLAVDSLLSHFAETRTNAIPGYRQFVIEGIDQESPLREVRHQLVLGDDEFVARHRRGIAPSDLIAVVKTQRRATALTLEEYRKNYEIRDEAMARAYWSTAFTMAEIGKFFGVASATVSRATRRYAAFSAQIN